MKEEILIGVDPGTAITGYGIVSKGPKGLTLIDYGCIRMPAKLKLSQRYKILFQAMTELIQKHSPTSMAIESQFVHEKNRQVGITIGMARGVITLAATLADIDVYEYTPKSVKLAATGSGTATKEQMQGMIQQYFRLKTPPEPADAADALAIAICHSHASETSTRMLL
jgi:crossover junction endodeoxyribonuclease RuvC